jgi:hypothetical protein
MRLKSSRLSWRLQDATKTLALDQLELSKRSVLPFLGLLDGLRSSQAFDRRNLCRPLACQRRPIVALVTSVAWWSGSRSEVNVSRRDAAAVSEGQRGSLGDADVTSRITQNLPKATVITAGSIRNSLKINGIPNGVRTRVPALKGRCPDH